MPDSIWGVIDFEPDTDLPDIRNQTFVHAEVGTLFIIPRERDLGVKMGQLDYDEYVNGISLHGRGTPSPVPREKKYPVSQDDEITSPSTLVSVEYPRSERSESERTIVIGREKK